MTTSARKPRGLVGRSQIKIWEREYSALGKQAQKIEDRRTTIKTMIDAARTLIPSDVEPVEKAPRKRRRVVAKKRSKPVIRRTREAAPVRITAQAAPTPRRSRPERGEWKPVIREIALTSDMPIAYSEAKQKIMKTPLGKKLEQSEKGFYHAISKLSKAGEIAAYKGHLFSPEAFRKFKTDLAAGRIQDLKMVNAAHHSPMGEAVDKLMRTRPNGAESGHIIWELRKVPEFAKTIERNKTHPYNVLARMVKIGELTKRGKRYYSAYLSNEAPSAVKAEGASRFTGEVSPSPNGRNGETQTG